MHRPAPADPFSLTGRLDKIKSAGLFRTRRAITSAQGAVIHADGRQYDNFSSNDYLGLANDPRLVEAVQDAAATYGVGSGASQLICGRSSAHERLEEALAAHTGRARAVVFSSGYLANLAVITTFATRREDNIVMDRENHASLVDGALLARAGLRRYAHNDVAGLERLCTGRRTLVATDAVFSMDGSIAALPDIASVCARHRALLAVDDAHGFGVLGETGAGALEHYSLDQSRVPVLMATFGKACGAMGAFVAGPEQVVEAVIQSGRSYIYTTALPPALAVAAQRSLAIVARETWRRERLRDLVGRFSRGAQQLDLPVPASSTPIQGFLAGSAGAAVKGSDYARSRGVLVERNSSPHRAEKHRAPQDNADCRA